MTRDTREPGDFAAVNTAGDIGTLIKIGDISISVFIKAG